MKFTTTLLILSSFLILTACSNRISSPLSNKKASSSTIEIAAIKLSQIQTINSIIPELAQKQVVFVGEQHTRYSDHLAQLSTIKGLHDAWGKQLSIGLEMVQQPYQKALDNYIAGKISERDMLLQTQWYDRWKYDFRLYRPIFNYARQHHIPLVALNIPAELTKHITKSGIDGLTPKERQYLPNHIDRSGSQYKNRIERVFNRHGKTRSKTFSNFFDAQLAWDEGMAFSAANYLKQHPQQKMVILAGGGHIINRQGIPARLERLAKIKTATVINYSSGVPTSQEGDYLLFTQAKELPEIGQIGIRMRNHKNNAGVIVNSVSPHGAAAKAGLKPGDIIIKIDQTPIKRLVDILLFREQKKPGDKIMIQVKRTGKILTLPVKLNQPSRMKIPFMHLTGKKPPGKHPRTSK